MIAWTAGRQRRWRTRRERRQRQGRGDRKQRSCLREAEEGQQKAREAGQHCVSCWHSRPRRTWIESVHRHIRARGYGHDPSPPSRICRCPDSILVQCGLGCHSSTVLPLPQLRFCVAAGAPLSVRAAQHHLMPRRQCPRPWSRRRTGRTTLAFLNAMLSRAPLFVSGGAPASRSRPRPAIPAAARAAPRPRGTPGFF